MGSELLVGVLEIDKGQEPRWATAEAVLTEMSDEEVKSAYMQATDTTEAMLEERGVELSTMRTEIRAALDAPATPGTARAATSCATLACGPRC